MAWYGERILPHLTDWVCGQGALDRQRAAVVPLATGRVVEIGFGGGLNLAHYRPDAVEGVWAVDPSPGMLDLARPRAGDAAVPVHLELGVGEALPFPDGFFHTAMLTFTLCTVSDPKRVLDEIYRVLTPAGRVVFCEHGRAPGGMKYLQGAMEPVWRRFAGGCHLTRPMDDLIAARFAMDRLERFYLGGAPSAWTYLYRGVAVKNEGVRASGRKMHRSGGAAEKP